MYSSKCALQVTSNKVGYNSLNVLPSKDMHRATSVKSIAKFCRFVPTCRNTSCTVCRIILLLRLLLLFSRRQSIRNVSFEVSKLPTSAFLLLLHSQSKILFCPEVVLKYTPHFGMLIEQRLHGLQFQKAKVFPLNKQRF